MAQPKPQKIKRPDTPLASTPIVPKVPLPQVPMVRWADNIKNKENAEYVQQTADDYVKPVSKVTQQEFNQRYRIVPDSFPSIKRKNK